MANKSVIWQSRSLESKGDLRGRPQREVAQSPVHWPGAIVEMSIWLVPSPVVGSAHAFKYSLFYGRPGQRIVGYDNERGKGDHKHLSDQEEPYLFTTVENLMSDFLRDVKRERGES